MMTWLASMLHLMVGLLLFWARFKVRSSYSHQEPAMSAIQTPVLAVSSPLLYYWAIHYSQALKSKPDSWSGNKYGFTPSQFINTDRTTQWKRDKFLNPMTSSWLMVCGCLMDLQPNTCCEWLPGSTIFWPLILDSWLINSENTTM